jgi:hypothetical protein
LLIRDNAQEGRLFQLHGKALLESTVEDRVACRIREISKDLLTIRSSSTGTSGLTPEIAREICERTGSAAVLDGSIAQPGQQKSGLGDEKKLAAFAF